MWAKAFQHSHFVNGNVFLKVGTPDITASDTLILPNREVKQPFIFQCSDTGKRCN